MSFTGPSCIGAGARILSIFESRGEGLTLDTLDKDPSDGDHFSMDDVIGMLFLVLHPDTCRSIVVNGVSRPDISKVGVFPAAYMAWSTFQDLEFDCLHISNILFIQLKVWVSANLKLRFWKFLSPIYVYHPRRGLNRERSDFEKFLTRTYTVDQRSIMWNCSRTQWSQFLTVVWCLISCLECVLCSLQAIVVLLCWRVEIFTYIEAFSKHKESL